MVGEQIPAFTRRSADADARFDIGCLYIGVNDVRAPDWDPDRFAASYAAALDFLAARCDRVLTANAPLRLGVPLAGAQVAALNAIVIVAALSDRYVKSRRAMSTMPGLMSYTR